MAQLDIVKEEINMRRGADLGIEEPDYSTVPPATSQPRGKNKATASNWPSEVKKGTRMVTKGTAPGKGELIGSPPRGQIFQRCLLSVHTSTRGRA